MRTLAFMSTPMSKYFQFPYGLKPVAEAYEELKNFDTDNIIDRTGFYGPVGLKDLTP